jgi:hypothetical protein
MLVLLPAVALPQGADDGRPLRVEGADVDLVFVDRVSAGRVADDRLLPYLVSTCGRSMPMDADLRTRLLATPWLHPWETAPDDSAWTVDVYAFPRDSTRALCAAEPVPSLAAALRGLQFTAATSPAPLRRLADAAVVVDGAPRRESERQRFAVTRVGPGGSVTTDAAVVRVRFSLDGIVPTAAGALPTVEVHVRVEGAEAPRAITIPTDVLAALWTRALPSRLERVAAQGVDPTVLAVAPPPPRDRELARARDAFLEDDPAEAARIALVRLEDDSLSVADRRIARVLAGLSFHAFGDAVGARLLLAPVVHDDPCFALAPGASAATRELLGALARPPARCVPAQMVRVAVLGAAIPGFGRPTSRSRIAAGVIEAGLVAGAFALSQSHLRTARAQYAEYLAVSPLQPTMEFPARRAARLYKLADGTRREAEQYAFIAIGLWIGALAEALIAESEWGKYYDGIARYGTPRAAGRVALRPFTDAGRIGFALERAP